MMGPKVCTLAARGVEPLGQAPCWRSGRRGPRAQAPGVLARERWALNYVARIGVVTTALLFFASTWYTYENRHNKSLHIFLFSHLPDIPGVLFSCSRRPVLCKTQKRLAHDKYPRPQQYLSTVCYQVRICQVYFTAVQDSNYN